MMDVPPGPHAKTLLSPIRPDAPRSDAPTDRPRYSLGHVHGERVSVAWHDDFGREFALKEIRPDRLDDLRALRWVHREPRVTGSLEHPNIVTIHEHSRREIDEARRLVVAESASMKPLPAHEVNSLIGGISENDLILCLAYKEAKALLKLDAAPPGPGGK